MWRTLDTVSQSLEYFNLTLVTPFYSNTKVKIDEGIKLPRLSNLEIFGFYEAVPALVKLCSGSLIYLKVTGRESSWISEVDSDLPVLRKAELSPTPGPYELTKLKRKCPETAIFPEINLFWCCFWKKIARIQPLLCSRFYDLTARLSLFIVLHDYYLFIILHH